MQNLIVLGGLVAVVIGGLALLSRVNELFAISVRDGKVLLLRGRVPRSLYVSLADVAKRAEIARGTIRAVRADGHARLVTSGIDEHTTQRLRNVFGTHPVSSLRAAPLPKMRNAGQLLGIAWLAWMLAPRGD